VEECPRCGYQFITCNCTPGNLLKYNPDGRLGKKVVVPPWYEEEGALEPK
jgi:hypothetical protein